MRIRLISKFLLVADVDIPTHMLITLNKKIPYIKSLVIIHDTYDLTLLLILLLAIVLSYGWLPYLLCVYL